MDDALHFIRGCGVFGMEDESVYNILRYHKESISVFYGVDNFLKQCCMSLPMRTASSTY